jgi:hypothetical protein
VEKLVIVLATVWFPHGKASKAGKLFIEVMKKYPRDRTLAKVVLDNAVAATKEGYKVISAAEIKDGKLKDYLAKLNQTLIYLAENLEGYKFEVEVLSSITEAMGVLGLESPV